MSDTPTLGGGWRIDVDGYFIRPDGNRSLYDLPEPLVHAIGALSAVLSTPADLPDGVVYDEREGAPSKYLLHANCEPPDGWAIWTGSTWVVPGDGARGLNVAYYVSPPQKPRTERVPHMEAVGRKTPGGRTITTYAGNRERRWVWSEGAQIDADDDGMVDVLIEDGG